MSVKAIPTVSKAQNGLGAFLLQCKRLEFHYCDHGGSSQGMRQFLQSSLPAFATSTPSVEMHVSPRPNHHPVIRAHYINAPSRAICVRNLAPAQVWEKAEILKQASGEKNRRVRGGRNVRSENESARGVWSGLHEVMRREGERRVKEEAK